MKRIAAATAFLLMVSSSTGVLQAATLESTDGDALNLRAGPGLQHQVMGTLKAGQAATVLQQEGQWFKVRLSSGEESWVAGWVSRLRYEDEERWAMVDTDVLNVRREPGLQAPILTRLMQDQRVRLLEISGDWWRVRLPDGTEGWVAAAYVQHTPAPGPADGQDGSGGIPGPAMPGGGIPDTGAVSPNPPSGGSAWPAPAPSPSAPEGTVPGLSIPLPEPATPMPGKVAAVLREAGLLAGRNSEARRLDTLRAGDHLAFVDAAEGWVKVQTAAGRTGWIQGPMVQVYEAGLRVDLADQQWMLQSGKEQPVDPQPPVAVEMRKVNDPDGLRLRQGPSTTAAVLTVLPQGARMEVLEDGDAWLRVKTSDGRVGWVFAQYAEPTDPQVVIPPAAPPILDENGYRVTLEQTNPGMVRLAVVSPTKAVGEPHLEAGVLTIPLATGETQERSIPVKMLGVQSATVGPGGLRLVLQGQPIAKVVDQAPGKVAIILRPSLVATRQRHVGENTVYSFRVDGQVEPQARAAGENIVIELPGALLAAPIDLPGVRVVAHDAGVRVAVNTHRAFALKRTTEGFDLVVYPPGLAGKTILLDPGHGGEDGGAVSRAQGVVEKEVNLQAALRLRALLEAQGARVYMTRATDRRPAPAEYLEGAAGDPRDQVDMQYRTQMANALGIDLFISIHHNAGDPGDHGTETYYSSGTLNGERSRTLAQLVQEELVSGLGLANRRAKDDTFYVTRNTEAPAILAELAFINHPVEGPRTRDPEFQDAAARALAKALERYYAERP